MGDNLTDDRQAVYGLEQSAQVDRNSIQLALNIYSAVMRNSFNEHVAFDAAVRTYRADHPDLPEDEARRAVASFICRKD